jgi:hypothetical protein
MNDTHEFIFLCVFFALVFVVPIVVIWASYNPTLAFDTSALWMHQNRIDKFAVIILGTWWVHTCSMIMWTLLRTVQTADYATYMGWAIPIIAKMFAPQGNPPPQ